jgi:hypothetical protein
MMTGTHTNTISQEQREKNLQVFDEMAMKEIVVWKEFHEFWLRQATQQGIPLLLVRYEDLTRHTDQVMSRVLQHALEVKNMNFFRRRIQKAISEEKIEQLGSYKPRSGGIGKSLKKYSPQLLQRMNSVGIVSIMEKLGYKDFLVPNQEEWDLSLEPLPNYAVEFFPTTSSNGDKSASASIVVNDSSKLVRTPQLSTNWQQVKQRMGMKEGEGGICKCWRCKERGLN